MSEGARRGLRLVIGAWYVAGAVLLLALLFKGDAGGLAARAGGSALALILLGFAIAAGARLAEEPGGGGMFGALTVLVATAALLLVAVEIWSKQAMHHASRTAVTAAVAILLGAISVLVENARPDDEAPVRLALAAAVLGLLALAVLAVLTACQVDVSPRLGGIAAALFVFPCLSLPALRAAAAD